MSPTKTPNVAAPVDPPVTTTEWSQEMGREITQEWPLLTEAEGQAKFDRMAAEGDLGGNLRSMTMTNRQGRVTLMARFGRGANVAGEVGERSEITTIEELYGIDLNVDIRLAEHFEEMTDDQIAWVDTCYENRWTEAEITAEALARPELHSGYQWSGWTDLMKALRGHYLHGMTGYPTTVFVLRISHYAARSQNVRATFEGINTVVTGIDVSRKMKRLLDKLPEGEWLKKPPSAEHMGRGMWRVTEEYEWRKQYSVVLGGTFTGLPEA
jgi:hypothetical protein